MTRPVVKPGEFNGPMRVGQQILQFVGQDRTEAEKKWRITLLIPGLTRKFPVERLRRAAINLAPTERTDRTSGSFSRNRKKSGGWWKIRHRLRLLR